MEANNTDTTKEINTNYNNTRYNQGNKTYRGRGGNFKKVIHNIIVIFIFIRLDTIITIIEIIIKIKTKAKIKLKAKERKKDSKYNYLIHNIILK